MNQTHSTNLPKLKESYSIRLFCFRHGETDWNKERRFQGHTDIPLNETGRQQAKKLIPILEYLNPELIISSDLSRALETAQISMSLIPECPLIIEPDLRECRLGAPEGMLLQDILSQFGQKMWDDWQSTDHSSLSFRFPNGESKIEHLLRFKNAIERNLSLYFHHHGVLPQRVGISTHGGGLRRFLHDCIDSPKSPIPIPNCCLYEAQLIWNSGSQTWSYHFIGLHE